jgi:hypothetical protein
VRGFDFSRCVVGISAATAILAGCGGSRPPIAALGGDADTRHSESAW